MNRLQGYFNIFILLLMIQIVRAKEKIRKILEQNNNYAHIKKKHRADIQTRDIVNSKIIEKIRCGLYKKIPNGMNMMVLLTFVTQKNAVIALLSAVDYHQFSTFDPPSR